MSRCAARLRHLRPAIPHADAAQVATVAFDSAKDLHPEEAAQVFIEVLNAGVPVHDLKRWLRPKEAPR